MRPEKRNISLVHRNGDLGRVPPQAPDLEQAVICAAMIDAETARSLSAILRPEHFYVTANIELWRVVTSLVDEGAPVDLLTVVQKAKDAGTLEIIGGPFYISQLANKVASPANAEHHARIIQQKFIQRSLINMGHRLVTLDETEDVFDTLDQANAMMAEVNAIPTGKDPDTAASILSAMADDLVQPEYLTLDMGILDEHVRMGPKCVVAVGARPSVGKTTFIINGLMNMARAGHKVLFISLEMTATQLMAKVGGILTGIDVERITYNTITDEERERLAMATQTNGGWLANLMVMDMDSLRSVQVSGLVAKAVKRQGMKVIAIDYLQCIEGVGDGPVERMNSISRAIKTAAKATDVRIIELSQLRRRDGADEAPLMSDLRESGQIEADADIIVLLGRGKGEQAMRCYIAKNKVGPIGTVDLPFELSTQRIGPLAAQPFSPSLPVNTNTERYHEDNPF